MDSEKTILSRLNQIEKMLTSQKTVLSFSETAEYTGLSKSYLYKLTSAGVIPHYKPTGKMLYFKKTEIDEWLVSPKKDRSLNPK
ncbi:MAG: helix-turn-helix domain-containing protein [Bacteroidetes bacterium]|nr:helix-turn-helix domain-containing protein [Bacteroidota bacterium]MBT4408684.1 helix-turn-helix domain-containing protein [Bacteroidota bacterium]MBT4969750.1 helix-turn-helix domain-containing protein [Bacteroidota bacterium]MBT5427356.1 helix-turn-helix domain-containing protein [Bacteroidota bacterium]MBT7465707.1 helix-turn-helix domain-containing protein [Bacteroidota bacterium]